MVEPTVDPFDYSSAEELLAAELVAVGAITAAFRSALKTLTQQLLVTWPGDDAPLVSKRLALAALPFDDLPTSVANIGAELRAHLLNAQALSVQNALAQTSEEITPVKTIDRTASVAQELKTAVREQTKASKLLIRNAETLEQAQQAVGVATRAATRIEAVVRTEVHKSANIGTSSVVDSSSRLVSVWRAERNACVHCLAYSGEINEGDGYPSGLTFGAKPLLTARLKAPPLHPNCRCDQIVVAQGATSVAKALKREAQRSILRGFSMESESSSARIDAARRLLQSGTPLARSVKAYAVRAIRLGGFPRGRDLPTL